jgi:signal transduction histidine kinase
VNQQTSVPGPLTSLAALDAMQTVLRRLSGERNLQRLCARATKEAAAYFGVTQCLLLLHDLATGAFKAADPGIGLSEAETALLSAIPADRVHRMLQNWPDYGVMRLFDSQYAPLADPALVEQLREQDVLLALVRADDQVLGVLRLANRTDQTRLPDEALHLLGFYAGQLGLLIHDLQLLTQEQAARRLAETLLKVPQVVRQPAAAGADLEPIFTQLLELLGDGLDCSSATVSLMDETRRMQIIASHGRLAASTIVGYRWDAVQDACVAHVTTTGQPLSITDTQQDPRWLPIPGAEFIRAWIGAPLWAPDCERQGLEHLIGMLSVYASTVDAFDSHDVIVAQAFADQMAIVLENQRLYSDMARRANEMATLREIATVITTHRDTHQLLNTIVERAVNLLGGEGGDLGQVDAEAGVVRVVAEYHNTPSLLGAILKIGEGVSGLVAQTGQPQLILDYESWPQRAPVMPNSRYGSLVVVPVRWEARVVGVLSVFDNSHQRTFTREEVNLLGLLADQASVALENAYLFEKTQRHWQAAERRSRELALLNQVTVAINTATDLNELLSSILTQLKRLLDFDRASIALLEGDVLVIVGATGFPPAMPVIGNRYPRDLFPLNQLLIESKQTVYLRDVLSDPRWVTTQTSSPVRSWIGVPLVFGGKITGMLNLTAVQPTDYSPEDQQLVLAVAEQAALALEKARLFDGMQRHLARAEQLYEDVTRRAAQLQAIQEVTRRINAILDPDQLLAEVADVVADRCGYDHVSVFLLDPTGEYLVTRGGSGAGGRALVAQGERLRIGDVLHDARYLASDLLPDTRSEMAVPIKLGDRLMGLLDVESHIPGAFDESDRFLLETLADQVAVAQENARLYATVHERAQQLATAYEELKALDHMKDEFVQTVSHELRTPLTFLKGYVELMLEGMLGDLNNDQREALTVMAERTENVAHLVNDIISLTRADSVELTLESVTLGSVALAAIQGAQAFTGQAGIELRADIPDDLPPVLGDPQRLGQVFDNLIGNAIKFSPDGGVIWVRLCAEAGMVRAEVVDQGIGIPADRLDRVWERFYQVDGATTRRFGGTGLGLAIVKRLVEAHGGRVGVTSVMGRGSTFFFTIPAKGSGQHEQ